MRKSRWAILVIVTVIVVIAGLLSTVVSLRGQMLSERERLTLQELERLAEKLRPAARTEIAEPSQSERSAESESSEYTFIPLPTRLERTASPAELAERESEYGYSFRRAETVVITPVMKLMESAIWMVDRETAVRKFTMGIAACLKDLGDRDGARRYYYEALEVPLRPFIFRYVCRELAWLETDPERAALLLKLSCQDDDVNSMRHAVRLCETTGSDLLAQHYLDRLRRAEPEAAAQYEQSTGRRDE